MTRPLITFLALASLHSVAAAQDPYECDDRYNPCGTPEQSGGGGGGGGGSILVNNTDLGVTYQNADDFDDDGVEDPYDLCPWVYDPDQADDDGDGVGSQCDNCPTDSNPDQSNLDGDLLGDRCDGDRDGDGVENSADLCPDQPDPLQNDTDADGLGDACDPDMDDDGVANLADNCPLVPNPDQVNDDPDRWGDACDDDDDGDGIRNVFDNCQWVSNADQANLDADAFGDACDTDRDGDLLVDTLDNCPLGSNIDQADADRDGLGDTCDDRFCYVVYGDADRCLDPSDPFTVYGANAQATTVDTLRLRLFANHENAAFDYVFTIVDAPHGSRASLENPIGAVSQSSPYEFHYDDARPVLFAPDKPGTYTIQVSATLQGDDRVTGLPGAMSESQLTVQVTGDPQGTGCATTGGAGGAAWTLIALASLLRRRR